MSSREGNKSGLPAQMRMLLSGITQAASSLQMLLHHVQGSPQDPSTVVQKASRICGVLTKALASLKSHLVTTFVAECQMHRVCVCARVNNARQCMSVRHFDSVFFPLANILRFCRPQDLPSSHAIHGYSRMVESAMHCVVLLLSYAVTASLADGSVQAPDRSVWATVGLRTLLDPAPFARLFGMLLHFLRSSPLTSVDLRIWTMHALKWLVMGACVLLTARLHGVNNALAARAPVLWETLMTPAFRVQFGFCLSTLSGVISDARCSLVARQHALLLVEWLVALVVPWERTHMVEGCFRHTEGAVTPVWCVPASQEIKPTKVSNEDVAAVVSCVGVGPTGLLWAGSCGDASGFRRSSLGVHPTHRMRCIRPDPQRTDMHWHSLKHPFARALSVIMPAPLSSTASHGPKSLPPSQKDLSSAQTNPKFTQEGLHKQSNWTDVQLLRDNHAQWRAGSQVLSSFMPGVTSQLARVLTQPAAHHRSLNAISHRVMAKLLRSCLSHSLLSQLPANGGGMEATHSGGSARGSGSGGESKEKDNNEPTQTHNTKKTDDGESLWQCFIKISADEADRDGDLPHDQNQTNPASQDPTLPTSPEYKSSSVQSRVGSVVRDIKWLRGCCKVLVGTVLPAVWEADHPSHGAWQRFLLPQSPQTSANSGTPAPTHTAQSGGLAPMAVSIRAVIPEMSALLRPMAISLADTLMVCAWADNAATSSATTPTHTLRALRALINECGLDWESRIFAELRALIPTVRSCLGTRAAAPIVAAGQKIIGWMWAACHAGVDIGRERLVYHELQPGDAKSRHTTNSTTRSMSVSLEPTKGHTSIRRNVLEGSESRNIRASEHKSAPSSSSKTPTSILNDLLHPSSQGFSALEAWVLQEWSQTLLPRLLRLLALDSADRMHRSESGSHSAYTLPPEVGQQWVDQHDVRLCMSCEPPGLLGRFFMFAMQQVHAVRRWVAFFCHLLGFYAASHLPEMLSAMGDWSRDAHWLLAEWLMVGASWHTVRHRTAVPRRTARSSLLALVAPKTPSHTQTPTPSARMSGTSEPFSRSNTLPTSPSQAPSSGSLRQLAEMLVDRIFNQRSAWWPPRPTTTDASPGRLKCPPLTTQLMMRSLTALCQLLGADQFNKWVWMDRGLAVVARMVDRSTRIAKLAHYHVERICRMMAFENGAGISPFESTQSRDHHEQKHTSTHMSQSPLEGKKHQLWRSADHPIRWWVRQNRDRVVDGLIETSRAVQSSVMALSRGRTDQQRVFHVADRSLQLCGMLRSVLECLAPGLSGAQGVLESSTQQARLLDGTGGTKESTADLLSQPSTQSPRPGPCESHTVERLGQDGVMVDVMSDVSATMITVISSLETQEALLGRLLDQAAPATLSDGTTAHPSDLPDHMHTLSAFLPAPAGPVRLDSQQQVLKREAVRTVLTEYFSVPFVRVLTATMRYLGQSGLVQHSQDGPNTLSAQSATTSDTALARLWQACCREWSQDFHYSTRARELTKARGPPLKMNEFDGLFSSQHTHSVHEEAKDERNDVEPESKESNVDSSSDRHEDPPPSDNVQLCVQVVRKCREYIVSDSPVQQCEALSALQEAVQTLGQAGHQRHLYPPLALIWPALRLKFVAHTAPGMGTAHDSEAQVKLVQVRDRQALTEIHRPERPAAENLESSQASGSSAVLRKLLEDVPSGHAGLADKTYTSTVPSYTSVKTRRSHAGGVPNYTGSTPGSEEGWGLVGARMSHQHPDSRGLSQRDVNPARFLPVFRAALRCLLTMAKHAGGFLAARFSQEAWPALLHTLTYHRRHLMRRVRECRPQARPALLRSVAQSAGVQSQTAMLDAVTALLRDPECREITRSFPYPGFAFLVAERVVIPYVRHETKCAGEHTSGKTRQTSPHLLKGSSNDGTNEQKESGTVHVHASQVQEQTQRWLPEPLARSVDACWAAVDTADSLAGLMLQSERAAGAL